MALIRRLLPFLLFLPAALAQAALSVPGADGVAVQLPVPASRIVSLAPHLTDTLLALGARARIVGVIDDHEQRGRHARSRDGLPVVGDAGGLNYEVLLALRPDLVLAWGAGTPQVWVGRMRELGLTVLVLDSRRLEDIPRETELLGQAAGRVEVARVQAAAQRAQLARLGQGGGNGPRLRYFWQAWRQPLYSLHGGHLLSQGLARCGADNILPPGPVAAPLVSPELVLREDPDLLFFAAGSAAESEAYWSRFASLRAVRARQWLVVADPRLTRPGPGMLSALEPVCSQISTWRKKKSRETR